MCVFSPPQRRFVVAVLCLGLLWQAVPGRSLAQPPAPHVDAPKSDDAPAAAGSSPAPEGEAPTEAERGTEDVEAPPEAEAPEADEGSVSSEAGLSPPKLSARVEPEFPAQAREAGLTEATVVIRVTLDRQGKVTAAEVMEGAGHGFDEAATRAALAHRFEPARRDGQPIPARVPLRIDFRAPTPAAGAASGAKSPTPTAQAPVEARPRTSPRAAADSSGQPAVVEVRVQGQSEAERLRRSAAAVQVVETEDAKRRTADLGEVLARTHGVGVQRAGGLGSGTRFSLNGLTDDQVRFFLDGVPLDFMGYPFGVANVPVNLVERVEIYRGVVPIRFGADALGGAVNLVSERPIEGGTRGAASLQAGSFGTYRLTLSGAHLDEASGWLTRIGGFFDHADNDYPMDDVRVANPFTGREERLRVYRFHDAYRAEGGNVETGWVDRPWADRLLVRGFATHYRKEIQHNLMMTRVYGDVQRSELTAGGTLRYENRFARPVTLEAVAGYAYGILGYQDLGECVYDWFGQCVKSRTETGQPGERVGRPQDQEYWEHHLYGRVNLEWRVQPRHTLRLSLSPTVTSRAGKEHRRANRDVRDPASARQDLFALVTGLEYQQDLVADRLQHVLFVKDYLQALRAEDPQADGRFRRLDRTSHRIGLGSSLRYAFVEWLYAKASYEWATRLPRADEIFGNVFPVEPNLELQPERSHNVNVGLTLDDWTTRAGELRGGVHGFWREADQLIALVGNQEAASFQNVFSARSRGVELAAGWTSPGEYVVLDGNFTYVDLRNTSSQGPHEGYQGKRVPNRPYLFSTGTARLQGHGVAAALDELALIWTTRYVHPFFRAWEGLGDDKKRVPPQLLHALALNYRVERGRVGLSFTGEVQNLTDARAYDFFGVLKPGRAFYFKATASL